MSSLPLKAFCDTSFLIAAYYQQDRYHTKAASALKNAIKSKSKLYISWFIIAETQIGLRKKAGYPITLEFLDHVRGGAYEIIYDIDKPLLFEAESIVRRYGKDLTLSLCDAISSLLIKQLGNIPCYCFDYHFKRLGVNVLP